jgi:hypothetical protein
LDSINQDIDQSLQLPYSVQSVETCTLSRTHSSFGWGTSASTKLT